MVFLKSLNAKLFILMSFMKHFAAYAGTLLPQETFGAQSQRKSIPGNIRLQFTSNQNEQSGINRIKHLRSVPKHLCILT